MTETRAKHNAIDAVGLTKIYGSGNTEVVTTRDATMHARQGEVVALLGPGGSGKSTFLTAVGLINPPIAGQITIGGKLIQNGAAAQVNLRSFRRQHIGFIIQKSNFSPFLSLNSRHTRPPGTRCLRYDLREGRLPHAAAEKTKVTAVAISPLSRMGCIKGAFAFPKGMAQFCSCCVESSFNNGFEVKNRSRFCMKIDHSRGK